MKLAERQAGPQRGQVPCCSYVADVEVLGALGASSCPSLQTFALDVILLGKGACVGEEGGILRSCR